MKQFIIVVMMIFSVGCSGTLKSVIDDPHSTTTTVKDVVQKGMDALGILVEKIIVAGKSIFDASKNVVDVVKDSVDQNNVSGNK